MDSARRRCSLLLFLTVLGPAATGGAQTLESRLTLLIQAHRGTVAVAVRHLDTGEGFAYREAEPMPTASLIKLPVMIEAYRQAATGKLDLDDRVVLREEDKVPGSGILTRHFSAGLALSLRDAVRLMIAYSDNTATNLVLDQIGLASTAKAMAELGCPETRIHSKVYRRDTTISPEQSRKFGLGSTTARDMVRLLRLLHERKLVTAEASEDMLRHLFECEDRTKLGRFLPRDVKLAHKTGAVSAARCDAGIIYSPGGPIAACVLTSENEDRRWTEDSAGNRLCAEIGAAVYEHFSRGALPVTVTGTGALRKGDSGRLVEDLQRTLNARLSPSPELAVDGDFGPVTEAAVLRFQRKHKLATSGIVDRGTWKALGSLITEDPPVLEPEIVAAEILPRSANDILSGPPYVTCRAWAVGNPRNGSLLWGQNVDEMLDMASTTKIMTALVVIELAETDPNVLDEEVLFSARADATPGSSARLRAGERLAVRELLYGLLLPSGNDAAVALAEHCGGRLSGAGRSAGRQDPLELFVAEMNRSAERLGMPRTHYANPHGLTEEGHFSTARDLFTLSSRALESRLFRACVATRKHGCKVTGPGGYRRNVVWANTNQLLAVDGYGGVKTGTTKAAGACLVSSGERGPDQLLVVVLGATSSSARYTDTRNLFRWAWLERGHRED